MNKTLQNVLLFHQVFNQYIGQSIEIGLDLQVKKLRHNLMSEEYLELLKAESEDNLVEIADALCDLKYVLNGTIIAHGLHHHWDNLYKAYEPIFEASDSNALKFRLDDYLHLPDDNFVLVLLKLDYFIEQKINAHGLNEYFADLFAEVQRSNMSKTCSREEIAIQTVETRSKEFGCQCEYFERNGYFVVVRSSDRKALKSIAYSKADLQKILAPLQKA